MSILQVILIIISFIFLIKCMLIGLKHYIFSLITFIKGLIKGSGEVEKAQ